jgi:ABC-type branched-subunit amino acid transport system substrate-binding protein
MLVLLLFATACTGDGSTGTGDPTVPVVGVTDTEVLLGGHGPGSSRIYPAIKAYFDYVNAKGGIHGRKITYRYSDDGSDPAVAQTVVKKLVEQDKVFAILNGLGTATHTAVLDFLKQEKVPDLFVGSGSLSWNQPTMYPGTFAFQIDHKTEAKVLASYVKTTWPTRKVCHFGRDDDFGKDSLAGVEQELGASSLVARQTYVPTNQDVAPQVGALKAAGCEVVVLATEPGFTALTLGKAAGMQFAPQWVASGVGGDYQSVATILGASKGLLDGLLTAGYLPAVANTTDPWNVAFKKIQEQYNKDNPYDSEAIYGYAVAYLFARVLQAAGKDLTRDGIVKAVEKGGYPGPGFAPILYSNTSHAGYGGARLSKVTAGTQNYFGPVYATDAGAGPVTEYLQPPIAPAADALPPRS